jgi:hypothetical protein
MNIDHQRTVYVNFDAYDMDPCVQGLQVLWETSATSGAWWDVFVHEDPVGLDDPDNVRLYFPKDDKVCECSRHELDDRGWVRQVDSIVRISKLHRWWTHQFFVEHPLTEFRICQHAYNNIFDVKEADVSWPEHGGFDDSTFGMHGLGPLREQICGRPSSGRPLRWRWHSCQLQATTANVASAGGNNGQKLS